MSEHVVEHGEGAHEHATPRTYVIILVILSVVTLLEVGTYFMPSLQARPGLLLFVLSVMAIAKFALVVGYYMHLRYDAAYYRRVFITPLIIALAMILVVMVLTATRFLL